MATAIDSHKYNTLTGNAQRVPQKNVPRACRSGCVFFVWLAVSSGSWAMSLHRPSCGSWCRHHAASPRPVGGSQGLSLAGCANLVVTINHTVTHQVIVVYIRKQNYYLNFLSLIKYYVIVLYYYVILLLYYYMIVLYRYIIRLSY